MNPGNLAAVKPNTASPYDNKIYFQRAPFIPPKMSGVSRPHTTTTLPSINGGDIRPDVPYEATSNVDPLDWVSLPDLFFGDSNYQQNLVPNLEMPNNANIEGHHPQHITHTYAPHHDQGSHYQGLVNPMTTPVSPYQPRPTQQAFPPEKVNDFKHVIYNLLVENHNNPHKSNFIMPCTLEENGVIRHGFCFNEAENPEKKLPELYAQHIRKARLDQEDISSVFVHDLYKFYLRASVELLSKYFEKRDKYTYLYEDTPLFIPNDTLEHAEERIRNMKTRARKKRKLLPS